jgi:hypothetical protein
MMCDFGLYLVFELCYLSFLVQSPEHSSEHNATSVRTCSAELYLPAGRQGSAIEMQG